MDVKRKLINTLPPSVKRVLAVPYDYYQTRNADRQFAQKHLPTSQRDESAPDHIVCVVVDALRADHIDSDTTPYLSGLNGSTAITPGTWTFPAVSSLLSGVYPHEHGAMRQTDEFDDSDGIRLPPRMDNDRITITEALAGAGYDTYGGFGHDTPFVALSGRFETHNLYHTINSDADDVLDDYLDWVDGRDQTFAFLHLADPHTPVDPPKTYRRKYEVDNSIDGLDGWRYETDTECDATCQQYRDHRQRLYRASVDYVDDAISEFGEKLESFFEDPLLMVTADHGEAHWEHVEFDLEHFDGSGCVDHGGTPYEAVARVPFATNADWDLERPLSLIDIPTTLADITGVGLEDCSGHSLIGDVSSDRIMLIEGSLSGHEKKAVYRDQSKLIASKGHNAEFGFSLPDETVVELPDEEYETMKSALPPWPSESDAETEVSGVVEDRLEQLGYK
ncbi:sulfatase-like hydrolase/transferase [Halorubrum sp. CSM-61]|uniref:sulfatase-like hydrolase/transferase n=1 Tax=Halorubrum sp. CSM-61 TaxID=2485838 RepID=UPI000F4CB281|nr:sulfatase-like hydrolase/transferase [Halorubrum sp. CSM-61]